MYEANIQKQHLNVFKGRLQKIKPLLDLARKIICSRKILQKNIYISGECAAWLIGRTDIFDELTIFLLGQGINNDSYSKFCEEFELNTVIPHWNHKIKNSYDWHLSFIKIIENQLMEFPFNSTPPLKFILSGFEIHEAVKHLFNFAPFSVFINLFDTNEILTAECRCNYELNCMITQNDCMSHSRVVYPLLLDSTALETMWIYHMLKNEVKQLIRILNTDICIPIGPKNIHYIHESLYPYLINLLTKYSKRLLTDPNLYPNRIMSFCDYSCTKCIRRDKLTKKYSDMWRHKTYAPEGYGCKAAGQRFKGIDTDLVKQYCTCKSLNQTTSSRTSTL